MIALRRVGTFAFKGVACLAIFVASTGVASAQDKKPNILVIWADDVGWFNPSCYNRGMMGYRTPNMDRIASEGMMFTDCYAQQSCTAGRSTFITGQSPIRTGLLRVGLPGADLGLQKEDPTIAWLLKAHGYMTAQYGKNHLGDRDEMLPTNHGFDEFFGNLYHLNAEEEPENEDYPKDPAFKKRFGPRGVIKSTAGGEIVDTGPLTKKRMETIDEEVLDLSLDFMERAHKAGKPFFLWHNSTRMHVITHLKESSKGVTGEGIYADGLVEHDGHVGKLLAKLDELGIADNTIVKWSSDNGAEVFTWPDGGMTPFHGEKNTNWEGGYRVPCMIRWPGKIKPGQISNETISHEDWLTTFLAAAGDTEIKEKLKKGAKIGGRDYKVHLDGYNFLPYFTGKEAKGPRKEFFYWNDGGELVGLRYGPWKVVFMEQRAEGFEVWSNPWDVLRVPKIFNLHRDPFEKAQHESDYYVDWMFRRIYLLVPAQAYVGKFLMTFMEFPRRQEPASFNLDKIMKKLESAGSSGR